MRALLGIDLGSTTTKAVVLGEGGEVLGRGLTNTRANFETACAVARDEALADARLGLLPEAEREPARARYTKTVREHRHARLSARATAVAGGALAPAVGRLGEAIRAEVVADGEGAFREVVLRAAASAAERREVAGDAAYEALLGALERALVEDEADPSVLDPESVIEGLGGAERIDVRARAGTGYGRHRLPFEKREIRSEILCHGLGARHAFPGTRTVLDIGGQDTKAIQLDEAGLVTSFQMNDRCAAGCGRYLGYVAEELGIGLADLAPLAMCSGCPSKINSTCTVFAGAEIRDRMALGEKREDVVAGLHRAIVLRAVGLLARSGGVRDQLTFSGGVARNAAAVHWMREEIAKHYGPITINVSPDGIFNGAIGAALFARMEARA